MTTSSLQEMIHFHRRRRRRSQLFLFFAINCLFVFVLIVLRNKKLSAHWSTQSLFPQVGYYPHSTRKINTDNVNATANQRHQANPNVFGWTPGPFPNPHHNPTRCGIAYLNESLYLCDPDLVLGGVYLEEISRHLQEFENLFEINMGVAVVRKMNLNAILHHYYDDQDEDDMVNDGAQLFARSLHDNWFPTSNSILVFLSVSDRVLFISTSASLAQLLPWWRLDHIVSKLKADLKHLEFGNAILRSIQELKLMLESGPPTWEDRFSDFITRFGVVIAFAVFTFLFGAVRTGW